MRLNVKSLRVIALAVLIGTTTALAQEVAAPTRPGMGDDQSTKMMAMRRKMMAEMKAMDAKMDPKVAAMNAARGTAKTDAIAAVINEMLFQQKQMMANMDTMCKEVMEHMAHPDAQMKGMDMGKSLAGSSK